MRIEQKYFVPFMLAVAALCIVLITYFNFRSAGQQQQHFTERVGDGRALYEHTYPQYFKDDGISPQTIAAQDSAAVALLFWGSWSDRSAEALRTLQQVAATDSLKLRIFAAAIKDGEDFIREVEQQTPPEVPVFFVEGDEIYNELKLPGLPSLIVFDADGGLHGARYGYSGASDYDFIRRLND
ncbi:MAG: TlpA family protein disulfide reductase [Cyclonatronaceae bacterium]